MTILDYTDPSVKKQYNPADSWQNTALHESGHVVAAIHFGRAVESVRITSERLPAESTDDGDIQRWTTGGDTRWDSDGMPPRDLIIVALAGQAARSLVDQDARFDRFDLRQLKQEQPGDYRIVVECLASLGLTEKQQRRELARLWHEARSILQQRWPEVVTPNAGATCTVAYDAGGLTVSPASGGTLTSTTSFATTAYIDYTITRAAQGGTPRRVAFTVSATGFVDGTDAVDAMPKCDRFRCRIRKSTGQNLSSSGLVYDVTWDVEDADSASLHDNVTNNHRITIPSDGNSGFWLIVAHLTISWNGAATGNTINTQLRDSAGTLLDDQEFAKHANDAATVHPKLSAMVPAPAVGEWFKVVASSIFTAGTGPQIGAGVGQVFFEAIHVF